LTKAACWVELRYGWGLKGIPIGQTASLQLLKQVKESLLAEAERRAEVSHKVDPVLGFIEEQELEKLRRILGVVIPNNGESNIPKK
jgi:hypothetical protein